MEQTLGGVLLSSPPMRFAVRSRGLFVVIGVALALLGAVLATGLFWRRRGGETFERAGHELDRRIEIYRTSVWRRPVLRGEPIEGNAADAQREAVRALGPIDEESLEALS